MSAVIGVILIIAITVILAAAVAAFVFYAGGNLQKSNQVGVEVKRTAVSNVIIVKTIGGTNIANLNNGTNAGFVDPNYATYTVTVNGRTYAGVQSDGAWTTAINVFNANQIGAAMHFGNSTCTVPDNSDVTIVAHFNDGTNVVVWSGNLR
jgi:FlaG/FlaF family flagellin (archaellin)